MPHEIEVRKQVELDATPEQVWEAIATGPGIDAWFMGRNQVEPREGGTMRMTFGEMTSEKTVTAWEPPHRFASRSATDEDGSFMAFEYLVEGRAGGGTVLRLVQSGMFGGDDWEAEHDALAQGWDLYLRDLASYLTHFPGRTATPVSAWGPPQPDDEHVWKGLERGLGLTGTVAEGDRARFTLPGSAPVEGVVDAVSRQPIFLGVRTGDALYRFVGMGGMVGVGHHLFADGADQAEAERAWSSWLAQLFA
jgi:uncharacterized protein YndB with AHSA1/START domain